MTDVRNMRKLMESMNVWEADVVDNSEEFRRKNIIGNFESDLNDLIYEYYHGAETFGNAHSPGIKAELEKVLRDASFGVK